MAKVVLDASALLTLFQGEPGSELVAQQIADAAISALNLSEVVAKLAEKGLSETGVRDSLAALDLEVVDFDREQAFVAGFLRPGTRNLGLSLGDLGCLSLARGLGLPVLTADRSWRELNVGVEVRVIR
ncbi:MAG: type II toxin-antitoxin system VapC family toxin [Dehalococcoidia bacterium]|nr:type II toxin-antitoxin system VapC family toxin [Dehalococcoidia bacterium]